MFKEALSKKTLRALDLVSGKRILPPKTYLAGGTAGFRGIEVADIRDIAAMKIAAISDRGTKRDFIDLYFIISEAGTTLREALNLYGEKFKILEINRVHILKSLVYFQDADNQKMPRLLKEVNWPKVKKFFENEVKKWL